MNCKEKIFTIHHIAAGMQFQAERLEIQISAPNKTHVPQSIEIFIIFLYQKQPLYLHKLGIRLRTHHPPQTPLADYTGYVVVLDTNWEFETCKAAQIAQQTLIHLTGELDNDNVLL